VDAAARHNLTPGALVGHLWPFCLFGSRLQGQDALFGQIDHQIQLLRREVREVIGIEQRHIGRHLQIDGLHRLAPTPVREQPRCLEPIACPLAVIAQYVQQERGDRVAVFADELAHALRKTSGTPGGIAADTRPETPARDAAYQC
jgi:hypothetical protein